jgi:hypothetical protein
VTRRGTLCSAIAVAALVVWPGAAAAATTTATMPVQTDVPACNGDTIHLSGQLLGVFTFTQNSGGGVLVASHVQPQGVAGTDVQTGTPYVASGQTSDRLVLTANGGSTFTFIDLFHVQATRSADSFDFSAIIHVTTLADGTVTASVGNVSSSC